jgi:hypothetical protein
LICAYLIKVHKLDPKAAVEAFNKARAHKMERPEYIDALRDFQTNKKNAIVPVPKYEENKEDDDYGSFGHQSRDYNSYSAASHPKPSYRSVSDYQRDRDRDYRRRHSRDDRHSRDRRERDSGRRRPERRHSPYRRERSRHRREDK